MDFLENEYKKRFQNQRLSNDKIDADDLWAAIEENLENPLPKPSNHWVWLKKYRFSIAAIMLLLSVVFIYQWANSPKEMSNDMPITVKYSEKKDLNNQTAENNPSVNQLKNNLDNQKTFADNSSNQTAENNPSVNQSKNNLDNQKTFADNSSNQTVECRGADPRRPHRPARQPVPSALPRSDRQHDRIDRGRPHLLAGDGRAPESLQQGLQQPDPGRREHRQPARGAEEPERIAEVGGRAGVPHQEAVHVPGLRRHGGARRHLLPDDLSGAADGRLHQEHGPGPAHRPRAHYSGPPSPGPDDVHMV